MSKSKLDYETVVANIVKDKNFVTVATTSGKSQTKKERKLYRCPECTNSVTLTILAEVICTRCKISMRLFEAAQTSLFQTENNNGTS